MGLTKIVADLTGKGVNKSIGIGKKRLTNGFGYIIIPDDIERDAYIRSVNEKALLMIVTSENQVIKNVNIPKHILIDLTFPEKVGEIGQMIHWMSIPKTNQLVLTGIYRTNDQFSDETSENIFTDNNVINGNLISIIKNYKDTLAYVLTVCNRSSTVGGIKLKAYSTNQSANTNSTIELNCDGSAKLYGAQLLELKSNQAIKYQIGFSDKKTLFNSTLTETSFLDQYQNQVKIIDKLIQFHSPNGKIALGDQSTEKGVLGDKLQTELNRAKDRIDILIQAIQSAPTVPQDGGAAFKASIVTALQSIIQPEDYSAILSDTVTLL